VVRVGILFCSSLISGEPANYHQHGRGDPSEQESGLIGGKILHRFPENRDCAPHIRTAARRCYAQHGQSGRGAMFCGRRRTAGSFNVTVVLELQGCAGIAYAVPATGANLREAQNTHKEQEGESPRKRTTP
jgi:hypothetical protein